MNIDGRKWMAIVVLASLHWSSTAFGSPVACTYSISPTSRVHGWETTTGLVAVAAVEGCAWNVINTNAWVTIASGSNSPGNGLVRYIVSANPSIDSRSGHLFIADQLFSITQLGAPTNTPCSFTITPTSASYGAGLSTGFVSVATAPNCFWSVINTNPWVTIIAGTNVTGSGSVFYRVFANNNVSGRNGNLFIAGQLFSISQAGGSGTNGTISLAQALDTAGAPITVSTVGTPPWTGQTSVTHDGIDAAVSGSVSNGGATTVQAVMTGPGTLSFWWKVSSEQDNDYLKFFVRGLQQASISGETDWEFLTFELSAGTQTSKWTYAKSVADVAGQDRAWLDQVVFVPATNAACSYVLTPTARTHGYGSVTGVVNLSTGPNCAWGVINTNPWITVLSGSNGMGSAAIPYWLAPNPGPAPRNGYVAIANRLFSVTQLAATNGPCTFTISPTTATHGSGSSTGFVSVAAPGACSWIVVSTNAWITIASGANGIGSGTVRYTVAANPGDSARSATLLIAGQTFTIQQAGNPPPLSPFPVQIPTVTVSNLGHRFFNPNRIPPGPVFPIAVVDCLVDQDGSSGGGAVFPNVTVNWDTNTQFSLTVSAPEGHKFLVQVPPGRAAAFNGFIWWESTRGGFSGPGTVAVNFIGLEGTPPTFEGASPVLSDSHGFFGFADVEGSTFTGDLSFQSITLTATVIPEFTGNGSENYVPHHESALEIFYQTTETNDPGPFVSIVPVAVAPRIAVANLSPDEGATLMVQGPAGRTNIVECSEDLIHWIPIRTNVMPATTCPTCPFVYVNDNPGSNAVRRFYRAKELP